MTLKLTKYLVATPPIVDSHNIASRVLFSTRTAEMRLVDDRTWHILRSGEWAGLPAEALADLVAAEILVSDDQDELSTILQQNRAAALADDVLSLVIMPTASCQLGCGYCGQEHTSRWLSAEHQDQFLALARAKLDRGKFRHLFIRWFGAEPLSGLGVIRRFSPRLRQLAARHGCTYGARIVTNGLALTPAVARELVTEHGVQTIDITLDGPPEHHDARRMQKNGRPTFSRIFTNVVALARSDLAVEIRL